MEALCSNVGAEAERGRPRVPLRNVWLLLLYASELLRSLDSRRFSVEDNADEIPDLVAELLAGLVERRLRRNLSRGYRTRDAVLGVVRGRIDTQTTLTEQLLDRCRIACRFNELTLDTPRNRYVCAALTVAAGLVTNPALAHRCRELSGGMQRHGVVAVRPVGYGPTSERFGRHDADDAQIVAAAALVFDLHVPTQVDGATRAARIERDEVWLRTLFERAVGGFYRTVLSQRGWRVRTGTTLRWPTEGATERISAILPSMRTDIVLEHPAESRRIIIDTKFAAIFATGWYREQSLKSGYLYQIYAYLRTQERESDPLSLGAEGLLLHPVIGRSVDESVTIQGHRMRFATVDLTGDARGLREALLRVVGAPSSISRR